MLKKYFKDIQYRKNLLKSEKNILNKKIIFIKSINIVQNPLKKYYLNSLLNNKNLKSSKVKINNRCRLTSRGRGSLRKFGASRIILRNMLAQGIIPNYKKSTW